MALPNEIQVGRYNRFVQKLLSIKGKATTYLASPELDFVLPLFHGVENRYLEAWDLFGREVAAPAPGVGNFATFALRNPVGSNVVATITRMTFQSGGVTSGSITLFRPGTNGAGAGDENTLFPMQGWDGRGRTSSTCILSNNTAAQVARGGGVAILVINGPSAGATLELLRAGDEIVLTPGSLLTLSDATANDAVNANFWWRERFLEDSERA